LFKANPPPHSTHGASIMVTTLSTHGETLFFIIGSNYWPA
jgi:hypothetical protein